MELRREVLDLLPVERPHDGQHLVGDGRHRAEVPAAVDLLDDDARVLVVVERGLEVGDRVLDGLRVVDDVVQSISSLELSCSSQELTSSWSGTLDDDAPVLEARRQRLALGRDLDARGR